ncbi:putative ATP-dependent RNA helicase ucp12 [Lithohypha guttulata]|uniref:ATP-dependent RNA helicase ucp12 n=1 Tax=Lithohypha guttulata TaxID=1690604 RepID=A0AAN7T0Y2_9EURO|nr:putative ATP-dependent RNA helicase ucp12 [Lithohypha guttulata]
MPPKKAASSKSGASKPKPANTFDEGSHIVFEDDNKKSRKGHKPKDVPASEPTGPPKPTVKQLIGGASWTGKLPVNLLSEHCQRQKWDKPDYTMRQVPGRDGQEKLYRSEVSLSAKDAKTGEVRSVKFRTPETMIVISEEPTALEARHFAAAYALFRVSSMKNLSMALPPKYRDLWKQFQSIKKEDEKVGKAWLYDADPFAAQQKGEDIKKAMEKRDIEKEKKKEAISRNPALALQQMPRSREWGRAPKIEMGSKIRMEIERLVRQGATWNPFGDQMTSQEQDRVAKLMTERGFRAGHAREAMQYCKDEEEVLEWLLVNVPEDDLPAFALPANYSAGISMASGDVVQEAKLKRLATAGYPRDFVMQALKSCDGNEHRAAFWLQSTLQDTNEGDLNDDIDSMVEWDSEESTLEAIYADRWSRRGKEDCTIKLDTPENMATSVRFVIRKKGYPWELPAVLLSSAQLPAYIRLSATKQALQFADTNFKGQAMVFQICEWLEANLQNIIDSPMSLTELHLSEPKPVTSAIETPNGVTTLLPTRSKNIYIDRRSDREILDTWSRRHELTEQQKMLDARKRLPAWTKECDILTTIAGHSVTIVTGETGSGKSTQVVQFVLDQAIQVLHGSKTKILCTQPRRVAALSLADRVSNERCTPLGEEVGYIIRGESKTSNSTKITFMTTGVLLRRIQMSASLKEALDGISHVFIDEVHERSLDTDFLLALLKDALKAVPSLRVVLMSATLDKDIFMKYFGGAGKVGHVHVEGRTFPVTDHYLEEVLDETKFIPEYADSNQPIGKIISALGVGVNIELIRSLVVHIDEQLTGMPGAILIFLPGTLEIDRSIRALSSIPNVFAYPLHASLLPSEQKKVFPPAPSGKRKVIAATNVAETSITIEDVVAVIDTGRVKETNYDISNNIVRLEEVWASQAACKQRRGRAGRVREGTCYKLFTRNVEANMTPKPLPEIQRVPLEQLCLSVKASDQDRDVSKFLGALITPPEAGAISNAINVLHQMGALEGNHLTALGTYMSAVPADLRCAKLLVYGALFDCLEPCLTVASILTVRDPFVSPRDKREEADAAKAAYSTQHGDLMLSLSAYEDYIQTSRELRPRALQSWCNTRFLSLNTLRDITSTRSQLVDSLKDANLIPLDYRSDTSAKNTSPLLHRALISASLQPQIAEIRFPEKKYMQSLTGAKELDPEAKTIKYFLPPVNSEATKPTTTSSSTSSPKNTCPNTPQPTNGGAEQHTDHPNWQRVFIHPSSPLFHSSPSSFTSGSSSASYLCYFSKMATGSSNTLFGPKPYIHSLTPLNVYTQLLFGSGGINIDTTIPGGGLVVSEHFKIRGWARIGVLVSRLRRLLDEELRRAIDVPAGRREFGKSEVVKVVKWLIELNGQDR